MSFTMQSVAPVRVGVAQKAGLGSGRRARVARGGRRAQPVQAASRGDLWTPQSSRPGADLAQSLDLTTPVTSGLDIYASKGPNPMVMERFQSVVSQLMQQRIIRMGGAVDDDSCNLVVAQLLWLDAVDPKKDITIYVNSPGGSVTAGMAVFDTMRHIRPDVSTVCVGLAASMGAFLLASGAQGKRYSLPNSRIMIHQPLGGAQGQAADIEIQANEIMHHKATLNGYLAEFCNKPLDEVMADTDRDFFMSADEAKTYGLIDHVIEHPSHIGVREAGIPMYAGEL